MKYIFMGKICETNYIINEYDLKYSIELEEKEILNSHMRTGFFYPSPEIRPYHYYWSHVVTHSFEKFSENEKIEYKIEDGSHVKLWDKSFKVDKVVINQDGSITCYTDHVIKWVDNGQSDKWAEEEVLRVYNKLKQQAEVETSTSDVKVGSAIDSKVSFWTKVKNFLNY